MKTIIKLLLITSLLSAGYSTAVVAKELKLGSSVPEGSPWGQWLISVAESIEERSGGELSIDLFLGGQLGNEETMIRQVVRGRLDLMFASNTAISVLSPGYGLLTAPYLWDNEEQLDCFSDQHIFNVMGERLQEKGLILLSPVEVGYQILFSQTPVRTPDQLTDVKVRTAPTKSDSYYIDAAGGASIPLGITDSMPAVKTGMVSAASWPTVFGISSGYHEVAQNVTVTNHLSQIGGIIGGNRLWNSLNDQEKEWLRIFHDESNSIRATVRSVQEKMLADISKSGANVIHLSAQEEEKWRSIAPRVQEQIVEGESDEVKAIWAEIINAKDSCTAK